MNKLIKSMMLVAGLTVVSITNAATTPAEDAGICAANAAVLKRHFATMNYPSALAVVTEQSARLFNRYGNQPGFEPAFRWEFKQNRDVMNRIQAGDGCLKAGF